MKEIERTTSGKLEKTEDDMWTMRNGTQIRIVDMDDEHLVNAIKMLIRNANRYYFNLMMLFDDFDIDLLESMDDFLDDMAVLNDMNLMMLEYQDIIRVYPTFGNLFKELVRRIKKLKESRRIMSESEDDRQFREACGMRALESLIVNEEKRNER